MLPAQLVHSLTAAPAELPLWGRRILVTGPRQYAGRLAAPLAAAGARVVAMPCITIQRLEEAEQLQVRLGFASHNNVVRLLSSAGLWHVTRWFCMRCRAHLGHLHVLRSACLVLSVRQLHDSFTASQDSFSGPVSKHQNTQM